MNTKTVRNRREIPKAAQEINAVLTIAMREIITTIKVPTRIVTAIIWPIMFLWLMGGNLMQNMGTHVGYNFNQFMLTGMLINGMFMMIVVGITTLVEDRENDFTQEMFVAPVSRYSIIIGKIVGTSFTGYIEFLATIIVGLCMGISIEASQLLKLLAISPLMCIAAGSLGVMIIGFIHNSSTAGLIVMTGSMLQMFLSGALIPINNTTGAISVISHIMPLTYCLDFSRGIFYAGTSDYSKIVMNSSMVNLAIILTFTVIFFILGTIFFVRSEKNR